VPIAFLATPSCADPKGYSEVATLIELQPVANVEDARAKRGAPFEVALKS
jgi:hypothetical protein